MPLEYSLQHRGQFSNPNPWKSIVPVPLSQLKQLGIESLPNQRCVRAVQKPFVFNVMVVGESGLGKSTFINTFFNSDLKLPSEPRSIQKTERVEIRPFQYQLEEGGVVLNLSVIDTPGFGDQLDRDQNLSPIIEYINSQYQQYLDDENSQEIRQDINDTRVHAILYFITPGNGLRQLDLRTLKELSEKANVIPVIAKSDTMVPSERTRLKQKIMNSIANNNVKIYPNDHCEDEKLVKKFKDKMPYAVMGSQKTYEVNGKEIRGRKYKWGVVAVENEEHCDFMLLKDMLMQNCLLDLVESTHTKHYALYRSKILRNDGRPDSILECDEGFESRIENRKTEFLEELNQKENQMRARFVQQVKDKENELKDREVALQEKGKKLMEEIEEEKRQLEAEERELDALLAQRNASPASTMNKKIFGKK